MYKLTNYRNIVRYRKFGASSLPDYGRRNIHNKPIRMANRREISIHPTIDVMNAL
jgi:hypothetical protein